ncbi:MAG: deoxyribodipyrimidine photo-lyase, partial [Bacteroidales bacterium]|nr:deoxyribodipyrimidine photo-lyase [Bacteroidales bacterium]
MNKKRICIYWFRRDLRLDDNHALWQATQSKFPVLPIFIFDEHFYIQFPSNDKRFNLIYDRLNHIHHQLANSGSGILVLKGKVLDVFRELSRKFDIAAVYCNEDYEPYTIKRDNELKLWLNQNGIVFSAHKDQVIFHKNEVLKDDGKPYTVYTPYKNKWLSLFKEDKLLHFSSETQLPKLYQFQNSFPTKEQLGIKSNTYLLKPLQINNIFDYEKYRDLPALDRTSNASVHLRFGFISIRSLLTKAIKINRSYVNELIWREFFMQILYHFPYVEHANFKSQYNNLDWLNNEHHFELWCKGQTGYPLVDAGMRELNETGYMHNRVRMVVASFLCKHLLIDWRGGEAYFAQRLNDYELS